MAGVKGRRLGVVVYAPSGTSEGDTPSVGAGGLIEWGPPGTAAGSAWMPLTTVVGGEPELVWDGDDSLIPTLTPI